MLGYTQSVNIEKELKKATQLLATMMQLTGLTRQEVDRRLGAGRGFTSQVLTGRVELKLRHVLEILKVVDFAPSVFFRLLFPESAESPVGQRPELLLHQLLQGAGSWAASAATIKARGCSPATARRSIKPA